MHTATDTDPLAAMMAMTAPADVAEAAAEAADAPKATPDDFDAYWAAEVAQAGE